MSNWDKDVTWLPAQDPKNPFAFEALDCRAAISSFRGLVRRETESLSFSAIEAYAQSIPSNSGPSHPIEGECAIEVRGAIDGSCLSEGPGSGHKWRLEFTPETVLARRRWTGQTIHLGHYVSHSDGMTITRLSSDRHWVFGDFDYAVAEMKFLLLALIGRAHAAFPVPPGISPSEKIKIALHGWKAHGPLAKFARISRGDAAARMERSRSSF